MLFIHFIKMAENKKSIIVYADWIGKFEELSDDEAGRLIKHFFRYVNDQNPVAPDRTTKLMFIDIEASLKRDLVKWERTVEGRSAAGKASAEAKRLAKEKEQKTTKSTNVGFVKQTSTNPTDNVSVNVSVSDSDILLEKETKENNPDFDFSDFWLLYPKKVEKAKCEAIFNRLSKNDKQKIKESILGFIAYKPFKDYNHPNPKTYLNGKRWNDEIEKTITQTNKEMGANIYINENGNKIDKSVF